MLFLKYRWRYICKLSSSYKTFFESSSTKH